MRLSKIIFKYSSWRRPLETIKTLLLENLKSRSLKSVISPLFPTMQDHHAVHNYAKISVLVSIRTKKRRRPSPNILYSHKSPPKEENPKWPSDKRGIKKWQKCLPVISKLTKTFLCVDWMKRRLLKWVKNPLHPFPNLQNCI